MQENLAAQVFHRHFAGYLQDAGYTPEQMIEHMWRPYELADLSITGEGRDTDLSKLALTVDHLKTALGDAHPSDRMAGSVFYNNHKIIMVVVPGFTHETLRNLSLHEEMERKDSPHDVWMLTPGGPGQSSVETQYAQGGGFKLVYAKYPRSNAASQHINKPLFDLLHNSQSLRRWVNDEGYKLVFMGYSYGCPLTLELLADMNSGRVQDEFILQNTLGFLALCGAIGGSYLADDVVKENSKLVSIPKLVALCRKYPWIGKIVGLPTQQFKDDMVDGVTSLTRPVRQERMKMYGPDLPAHVKYFSIAAVMPMEDYKRKWWQFNLDDYSMHLQAKLSEPFSVYNDGQVVLEDNLIPQMSHIPASNVFHLGAVRTHHWGVSYRTFNFGKNKFPRRAFYRALIQTLHDLGVQNRSS